MLHMLLKSQKHPLTHGPSWNGYDFLIKIMKIIYYRSQMIMNSVDELLGPMEFYLWYREDFSIDAVGHIHSNFIHGE